jgi:hypothetical protein
MKWTPRLGMLVIDESKMRVGTIDSFLYMPVDGDLTKQELVAWVQPLHRTVPNLPNEVATSDDGKHKMLSRNSSSMAAPRQFAMPIRLLKPVEVDTEEHSSNAGPVGSELDV